MRKKIAGITFSALCLATVGIYFWTTHVDKNQAHINKILDLARKTRPAPLDQLKNLLVDYSVDNDIKKTIVNFLQETVGQTFDESNIQQAGDNLFKGLSGNPLFFVRDAKDHLNFVVKVFENPFELAWGTFLKELSGLQLASTIRSKSFNFVSAQAIGKCIIDNKLYGLLAISPAEGISIADLIVNTSGLEHGSTERADAFRVVQRAFEKLGTAFTELHHVRADKKRGVHPAVIKQATEYLVIVKEYLKRAKHEIDIQALENYFYSLLGRMEQTEIIRNLAHGDTNFGNFMYNPKTDAFFMIDLPYFSDSADQEGNPIQNATFDLVGIIDEIRGWISLTDEERAKLKETFINAYGSIPEDLGREFFTLMYRLRAIFWASGFLEWKKDQPEKVLRAFKYLLQFSLDELKKSLSKFQESSK